MSQDIIIYKVYVGLVIIKDEFIIQKLKLEMCSCNAKETILPDLNNLEEKEIQKF